MDAAQTAVQTAPAVVTLLQFYPVLAAIGGLLFWAGILSNKLVEAMRRIGALETDSKNDVAVLVELGRIDQRLKSLEDGQQHQTREMGGVQRTLANLATGKIGPIHKFEQDEG